MGRPYKLLIFDFDGTLGDTKECVVASFQQSLIKNNFPTAARSSIIHNMGLSLKEVFQKLADQALPDAVCDKLVSDYRTFYGEFLAEKTLIFPEVKDTLEKIKAKGLLCSIATSKKTEFAVRSCKYLKIDRYFDLYIGDDKVAQKKPHPEMLLHTLAKLQINKAQAVMIGDATTDIEMGQAIGMDTIAVTWGAHPEDLLRSVRPTSIIHRFSEIMEFT